MWKLHDDTKCGCVDKRRPETLADNPDSPVLVRGPGSGRTYIAVLDTLNKWCAFREDGGEWVQPGCVDSLGGWDILHDDSVTITVDGRVRW